MQLWHLAFDWVGDEYTHIRWLQVYSKTGGERSLPIVKIRWVDDNPILEFLAGDQIGKPEVELIATFLAAFCTSNALIADEWVDWLRWQYLQSIGE